MSANNSLLHLFPLEYRHSLYAVVLATARTFMPVSLIVMRYTILEISEFLGQHLVDNNNDDLMTVKNELNVSVASPIAVATSMSWGHTFLEFCVHSKNIDQSCHGLSTQ